MDDYINGSVSRHERVLITFHFISPHHVAKYTHTYTLLPRICIPTNSYLDKIAQKEKEVQEKEALVSKKEDIIGTQRDFSNEILGQPLGKEEIEKALNDINDGLVQVRML